MISDSIVRWVEDVIDRYESFHGIVVVPGNIIHMSAFRRSVAEECEIPEETLLAWARRVASQSAA